MQRRHFIKNTAICVVAVSTSGFINFDGNQYVGDCETTSDILGPFYRPGSPVRSNLVVKGEPGNVIQLTGTVKHKDCITPYKKAKIEIWHCSSKGVYDNSSDAFLYRGTTFSDDKGQYSFTTILPVPYDVGGGQTRPAHFHLMITAEGYQPLVTQLYFSGDKHLSKDSYASSPGARRRILDVQVLNDGTRKVLYDIGMSNVLALEPAAIDKLVGVFVMENDKNQKVEVFRKENILWIKNDLFGSNLEYIGNNTFKFEGPTEMSGLLSFELTKTGLVNVTVPYINKNDEKLAAVYTMQQ